MTGVPKLSGINCLGYFAQPNLRCSKSNALLVNCGKRAEPFRLDPFQGVEAINTKFAKPHLRSGEEPDVSFCHLRR